MKQPSGINSGYLNLRFSSLFIVCFLSILGTSCVSTAEFNKVKKALDDCDEESASLKETVQDLEARSIEAEAQAARFEENYNQLKDRKQELEDENERLKRQQNRLESLANDLEKQLNAVQTGSSDEIARLIRNLEEIRKDLEVREEKLAEKNKRLQELESLLAQKDKAVKELKHSVMDALTGYKDRGITVTEKGGKIYVSLDEKLLFKTGKYNVDPKGLKALGELSQVLAKNPDIYVMVEGHTDDVPLKGTGTIKDNWDLSVMRATAVTKILLKNKNINPKQITAAGRSKFLPIEQAKTPSARAKNRRTEIILTPNLDELMKLLDN